MYDSRQVLLSFIIVAMAAFLVNEVGLSYHIEPVAVIAQVIAGMCFGSLLMIAYFNEKPA